MSDAVPVAEAMEEAQAVLDAETLAAIDAAPGAEEVPAAPVQAPLFEPPPFDFEEAYDELHRLDQRAKNRKSAWESMKAAARDAKEDYDSAINDLHDKFDEIDSARRVAAAVRQAPKPAETPAAETTTEGGDSVGVDETISEMPEEPQDETPEEETTDAPND